MLPRQRAHVVGHALVPPRDGDVEGVVARALLRPPAPGVVRLQKVLLRRRDDKVDDGRGAPRRRG